MTVKKIEFVGVDNITNVLASIRERSTQFTAGLLDDARKYSEKSKEQIDFIKDQISLIERRNKVDTQSLTILNQQKLASDIASAPNKLAEQTAQRQFDKRITGISKSADEDSLQVALMREQIEVLIQTSRTEIAEDKKNVQFQVGELKRLERFGMAQEKLTGEEQVKRTIQKDFFAEKDREDRIGMGGVFAGTLGANLFRDVLGQVGTLATAQTGVEAITPLSGIMGAAMGGAIGAAWKTAQGIKVAGFGVGVPDYGSILSQIGLSAGQLGGAAITRHITTAEDLIRSKRMIEAATGGSIVGLDPRQGIDKLFDPLTEEEMKVRRQEAIQQLSKGQRNTFFTSTQIDERVQANIIGSRTSVDISRDFNQAQKLGLSMQELAEKMTNVLDRAVLPREQLMKVAMDTRATELAFGVAPEETNRMLNLGRMIGFEFSSTSAIRAQQAGYATGLFGEENRNEARLMFSNISTLIEDLTKVSTDVNANDIAALVANFSQIGGSFSLRDPRAIENMQLINRGLSNPSNEFQQATNFSILRRLMPNAGLFDLMRAQAEGVNTPGFLAARLEDIRGRGGDADFRKLEIMKAFGLGKKFDVGEELFLNMDKIISGELKGDELAKLVERFKKTPEEMIGLAEPFVPNLDKQKALITDAYASSAIEGIATVADMFEKEMSRAVREIVSLMLENYKKGDNNENEPQ